MKIPLAKRVNLKICTAIKIFGCKSTIEKIDLKLAMSGVARNHELERWPDKRQNKRSHSGTYSDFGRHNLKTVSNKICRQFSGMPVKIRFISHSEVFHLSLDSKDKRYYTLEVGIQKERRNDHGNWKWIFVIISYFCAFLLYIVPPETEFLLKKYNSKW